MQNISAMTPAPPQLPRPLSLTAPHTQDSEIDVLARCDLNLLVVLNALLEERHVTRAGNRVGLSQPAASNALKRLRHMFADPLLTKQGNEMILSARAFEIHEAVRSALTAVRAAIRSTTPFDPPQAQFTARLESGDYPLLRILPELQALLQDEAPGNLAEHRAAPGGGDPEPPASGPARLRHRTLLWSFALRPAPRAPLLRPPGVCHARRSSCGSRQQWKCRC